MTVKEHPIIFSTQMVRTILDGRKTQTRRVIIPQPVDGIRQSPFVNSGLEDIHGREIKIKYQPGDLLWVRETWGECVFPGGGAFFARRKIAYKADDAPKFNIGQWRSPYHLFKKDARLWLRVIDVSVERLQDISEHDAICEGAPTRFETGGDTPRFRFHVYWDFLNAKRGYGWDQNPWVWVIEFKRIER